MENSGIVIRELLQEESKDVTDMVMSNLCQEEVNFHKAWRLLLKPLGSIFVVIYLVIVYMLTWSVVLSAVLAPFVALLSCYLCLWNLHQGHRQRSQPELQDIYAWYTKTGSRFWVAVDGQKIIGTVALDRVSDTRAELTRMCVLPAYRGKGLAKRLVKHLEDLCKSDGVEEIFLSTTEFHRTALCLYQKCGYVVSDTFVRRMVPLPGGNMSIVELSKKVQ